MKGVFALVFLGLCSSWTSAQFLNNRPFPTYSLENMPETAFSCRDKILGGYYADADAQCQMFHVCVKVAGVGVQDFRFLCPNGTAFDQDHQICADWEDVDCDATTLYYSSDNFDLYRIGSGFEAKLKKYGEDEETFALQRAETGDVRINKDHQTQRINQQKQTAFLKNKQRNQDNERDIFKGSSSSNFFNNKNGGKENDEDYDDGNANINQENDQTQRRKLNRKPARRPVQQNRQQYETTQAAPTTSTTTRQPQQQQQKRINKQPSNFVNNFAGSSYVPTSTAKPTTSISNERYTVAVNNHRIRNSHRHRGQNNNDNFRHSQTTSAPLTVSTPAPFRQTQQQQYNKQTNQQNYQTTTPAFKQQQQTTQNYAKQNYDVKKTNYVTKSDKKTAAPFANDYPTTFSPKFQKQYYQTTTKKFENYPTTFSPKTYNTISQVTTQYNTNSNNQFSQNNQPKPFQSNNNNNNQYTPLNNNTPKSQQYNTNNNQQAQNVKTTSKPQFNYNLQPFTNQKPLSFNSPSPFTNSFNTNTPNNYNNQFNNNNNNKGNAQFNSQQSTPKTTPFTQYTPTIPKVSQTTPASRSNRYDETQYDDGSYDPKYDYDGSQDEFLKTAHSQNIAKSRNDLAQSQKNQEQQKAKSNKFYDTPRPFSVSSNTPSQQQQYNTKPVQTATPKYANQQTVNNYQNQKKQAVPPTTTAQPSPSKKPVKDVSYDYAYYDTNVGSEPEYEIETEIKKSTVKN